MEEHSRVMIKSIKSKVKGMLAERHQLLQAEDATDIVPSKYWVDCCSYFDYMLGLSEEAYSKIRLHTHHLTADYYQTYYFGDPEAFRVANKLDSLVKDIPSEFILNEPEGGIGFSYDNGRFVSNDVVRFQKVVNTLYRYGLLSALLNKDKQERRYVLEIGGGYGGLAHHLSNILRDMTYIIVDLPEVLLFSASYLSLLNPHKRVYVYDRIDFEEFITSRAIGTHDFILIPNYQLHSLSHLRFDLVLNIASFQEMRTKQVETYLDFISRTCTGTLYSWNQDRNPANNELSSLSAILGTKFDLVEVYQSHEIQRIKEKIRAKIRNILMSLAILVGLIERPGRLFPDQNYREFICKSCFVESKL